MFQFTSFFLLPKMIVIVNPPTIRVFGSVVVVAFQSAFRSEIHQNNVLFLFFKNHF